jgi:hypothetical protein
MRMLCRHAVLVVAVLVLGAQAEAGVITFSDRAVWASAVGAPSFNVDFSGFAADTSIDQVTVSAGPFSLRADSTASFGFGCNGTIDVAPFTCFGRNVNGTSDAQFPVLWGPTVTATADVIFASPVSAWGADFKWTPGATIDLIVSLYSETDALIASLTMQTAGSSGVESFFGLQATAGEKVGRLRFSLSGDTTSNGYNSDLAIDNVAGVTAPTTPAVPEPTSLLLISTGISGIALRMRRQRRAKA